ncbi:hypothetical protein RD792_007275 [Penstemon davidsonii]|uniref:AAA+ ATPase domain-containing protein n=1 Tax=Penstemon davidsonii TaxID=160366 RepID=A0ABR0D6Y9_9LAMI|nr:hypothetical protein RD792_007275 [Penstemon davidsonii]
MTQVGSSIAGLLFAYKMLENFLPYEILRPIRRKIHKLTASFDPYLEITIPEYQGDGFKRSSAYASIERYLNIISTKQAQCLQANITGKTKKVVLTMAEGEEITDEYKGIKLWWKSDKITPNKQIISMHPHEDEKKYFTLTFHKRYRETVTEQYLKHVLDEGKAIEAKERQRKLYTNIKRRSWGTQSLWSHVVFEHPASFDTMAMDPLKKQEIMDDLMTFAKGKDYYAKIGKAWKRGYLLYGPPGTGKSTMIAAMANLLNYDIYDLELTSVKDNTQLRKLLIETSGKSIIVIEDIDCSLDLTGQRKKKKENEDGDGDGDNKIKIDGEKNERSQVTLSGLLNSIDGLWSACGNERIIVFTTNHVEKLDAALIRSGRMDKHIELSYCGFEAFKVLANNYLNIDSHHDLFEKIRGLLEETKITPADVAENLMPKSGTGEDKESCLLRLIEALEDVKKKEIEKKLKAEQLLNKKKLRKKLNKIIDVVGRNSLTKTRLHSN